MADFNVSVSPREAMRIIDNEIVNGSVTGEKIDEYVREHDGRFIAVLVYEKLYYRAGNRVTLTAVIDNLNGVTHIHAVGSGGGQGVFFRFDWGASDNFENCVSNALCEYIIE